MVLQNSRRNSSGSSRRKRRDICAANRHIRFTPNNAHVRATRDIRFVPEADIVSFDHLIDLCEQRGGTTIPSALAVLRLSTSSYLIGACTASCAP